MKRLAGTVFALSLLGSAASASAEPTARVKGAHPARAKSALSDSGEFDLPQLKRSDSVYRTLLAKADRDQDSRVSSSELEGFVQDQVRARVESRFQRLDRDRDGRVTRAEVPKMDAARFARFDADADGSFSLVELAAVMQRRARSYCERLLARLDVDHDGAVGAADMGRTGERLAELEASKPAK